MSGQVINRGAYSSFKTVRFNNDQIKQWPVTGVRTDTNGWYGAKSGFNTLVPGQANVIQRPTGAIIRADFRKGAYVTAASPQGLITLGFYNSGVIAVLGTTTGGIITAVSIVDAFFTAATAKAITLSSYAQAQANSDTDQSLVAYENQPIEWSVQNNVAGQPVPFTGGHKDNYAEITIYFDAVFVNNQ